MEGYSQNIRVKRNFETSLSNSGLTEEDQLGDITCPRSHLGNFFFSPGHFHCSQGALWQCFSLSFQGSEDECASLYS